MNDLVIKVAELYPNPYQPRKVESLEAVRELAENIERNSSELFDGLLQVPTVRYVEGKYELAFGHTRVAAFKYLQEQGQARYAEMRCFVRDLSDLQMFELTVSENIKRRDLNPLEQAEAVGMYMTRFKKTSVEAAEFFGVAASTIRGSVRLLNLPEEAKEKLRSGEINATEARTLLVVDRLIGGEGVRDALERTGVGIDEAINDTLTFSDKTVRFDGEGFMKVNPFPAKHWEAVKKEDIEDLIFEGLTEEERAELDGQRDHLVSTVLSGMVVSDEMYPGFQPEALERVRILAAPPACESCALHATLDGEQYCGFVECFRRKRAAWEKEEADQTAAKLGIPLYQKGDGAYSELMRWENADKKLVAERHADLRLMPGKTYQNFEGVGGNLKVVAVGDLALKRKKKKEKAEEKEQAFKPGTTRPQEPKQDYELERRLNVVGNEGTRRFRWEVAAPIFASALDGLTNLKLMFDLNEEFNAELPEGVDEMEVIEKIGKAKKAEGLKQARRLAMAGMLSRHGEYGYNVVDIIEHYAKSYEELAKDWGVKLPKNWRAEVEKYEAEVKSARKDVVEMRKKEAK